MALLDSLLNVEGYRASVLRGCTQAHLFGGKYIFSCPSGLVFFASPITREGGHIMTAVGGPVLMTDYDDYLDHDLALKGINYDRQQILNVLSCIPTQNVRLVNALANELYIHALYLGQAMSPPLQNINEILSIRDIHPYVWYNYGVSEYQAMQCKKLIATLQDRDENAARELLNTILGQILFHTDQDIKILHGNIFRFVSMLVDVAKTRPQVDLEAIFGPGTSCFGEIISLESVDEVVIWLNALLNRFAEYVFTHSKYINKTIHDVIDYMKSSYQDKITVEDIAGHFHLSVSYLGRIFRNATGINLRDYLNRLRIHAAKELLKVSSASVVDVSFQLGFCDSSYFSRVFKKSEGVSPTQYRRQLSQARRPARAEEEPASADDCPGAFGNVLLYENYKRKNQQSGKG
jgi:AraC-like DNA-binding protein